MTDDVQVPDGDRDVEGVILAHLQYGNDDDPTQCGCGLVEPDEVYDANDAHVSAGWHAAHVAAMLRAALASQSAPTVAQQPHHFMNADGTCHAGDAFEHGTDFMPVYAAPTGDGVAEAVARERERIAKAIEALRLTNPMNGDGSNHMLDKVIGALDRLAGDDAPSMAAAWERARRADADDKRHCEMHGQPLPSTSHVERLAASIARTTRTEEADHG